MPENLLIVGRGPSVYDYDSWGDMPIMAVSSAILAIPEDVSVAHFVTMDALKFFMQPMQLNGYGWREDKRTVPRAFWADERIRKHVPVARVKSGQYRHMPEEVLDALPERVKPAFVSELTKNLHLFGFQPSWGDCSNVEGWSVFAEGEPNFGVNGSRHLFLADINNSWLMAVQIAALLGFKRLHFVGCEFNLPHYDELVEVARVWHRKANDLGIEWVNLSPTSRLSEFVPTEAACRA